jgi:hypothetical protein
VGIGVGFSWRNRTSSKIASLKAKEIQPIIYKLMANISASNQQHLFTIVVISGVSNGAAGSSRPVVLRGPKSGTNTK